MIRAQSNHTFQEHWQMWLGIPRLEMNVASAILDNLDKKSQFTWPDAFDACMVVQRGRQLFSDASFTRRTAAVLSKCSRLIHLDSFGKDRAIVPTPGSITDVAIVFGGKDSFLAVAYLNAKDVLDKPDYHRIVREQNFQLLIEASSNLWHQVGIIWWAQGARQFECPSVLIYDPCIVESNKLHPDVLSDVEKVSEFLETR